MPEIQNGLPNITKSSEFPKKKQWSKILKYVDVILFYQLFN
mgnify:CR=1 FL=1